MTIKQGLEYLSLAADFVPLVRSLLDKITHDNTNDVLTAIRSATHALDMLETGKVDRATAKEHLRKLEASFAATNELVDEKAQEKFRGKR